MFQMALVYFCNEQQMSNVLLCSALSSQRRSLRGKLSSTSSYAPLLLLGLLHDVEQATLHHEVDLKGLVSDLVEDDNHLVALVALD